MTRELFKFFTDMTAFIHPTHNSGKQRYDNHSINSVTVSQSGKTRLEAELSGKYPQWWGSP